jgi:two-component system, OmpR family, sensor histidine kinase BaeS
MRWPGRIAFRLILMVLFVMLVTLAVPAGITVYNANTDEDPRLMSPEQNQFRRMIDSARVLCSSDAVPPSGLECPDNMRNKNASPQLQRDPFGQRARAINSVVVGVSIALVFAVLLAWVLARRIALPVQIVSRAASSVARGDLSTRAELPRSLQGSNDEVNQLAQNFNRMASHLEQQEIARRALFADIAHELRTPLTVLRAKLEAMQDGLISPEPENLEKLVQQTGLLERLVEDLRVLSLADAGALRLEKTAVNLGQLAKTTLDGFQPRAAHKDITLEFQGEDITLACDAQRMQQIIGNLLENALKHTPSGGRITLELKPSHDRVLLRVSDTGSGLPTDAFEKIWDRLYRVDASRNRGSGGSGLGLAIVKALVDLHGGAVNAANRAPHGAVFTVTLPAI